MENRVKNYGRIMLCALAVSFLCFFVSSCGDDDEDDDTIISVSVSKADGTIDGYKYVDLGLSVVWGWGNVGDIKTEAPALYGYAYAWGETATKKSYTEDNCETYGDVIKDYSGNENYDVATKRWGDSWRTPTKDEMEELVEECTWTWASLDGINGYKVEGPSGKSIFLPAAGIKDSTSTDRKGEACFYWTSTSTYLKALSYYAYGILADEEGVELGLTDRYYGHSVRPVSDED